MKRFLIVLTILCFAGVLAACFRDETQPQGTPAPSVETTVPTVITEPRQTQEETEPTVEQLPLPTVSLPQATLPMPSVPPDSQPDIPPPSPIVTEPDKEIV